MSPQASLWYFGFDSDVWTGSLADSLPVPEKTKPPAVSQGRSVRPAL